MQRTHLKTQSTRWNVATQLNSSPLGNATDRMEHDRFPNFQIWISASRFLRDHRNDLLSIFPLLFLPVFSDFLHSELLRQQRFDGQLHTFRALKKAATGFFPLLSMKLHFGFYALVWSFIPIYGWVVKDAEHRINWAMASNVLVFEKLRGTIGRKRCMELRAMLPADRALRTLITIPAFLESTTLAFMAFAVFALQNQFFFWVCFVLLFWILIPWSATVNTLLYLSIPEVEKTVLTQEYQDRPERLFEDYCPRCAHYAAKEERCRKLIIKVGQYREQFQTECNGVYFAEK